METIIEPFEYPDTMVENVKLFAQDVTKKNETLVYVQVCLSKARYVLEKMDQSSYPNWKKIEE